MMFEFSSIKEDGCPLVLQATALLYDHRRPQLHFPR
jgi:hypothetical protein